MTALEELLTLRDQCNRVHGGVRGMFYGGHNAYTRGRSFPEQATAIPLFLGADLLSACSQQTKYQYRIHSRYAKEGLASKVSFDGVRLAGINNSSHVWFYSVQGVFEAVFEFGGRELQRQIMTQLKDMWYDRYSDEALKDDITITAIQIPELKPAMEVDGTNSIEKLMESLHQSILSSKETICAEESLLLSQVEQLVDTYQQNISGLKKYPHNPAVSIFNTYSTVVSNSGELDEHVNMYDIPKEQHVFLCVVAEWLGMRLHKMQGAIEQKIELFKAEHISSLDQLPPPRNIVYEVFPRFMGVLISCWMTGESCGFSGVQLPDHTYTVTSPRAGDGADKNDSRDIWQFVQLILEFTNNTLLSGVAHVVYSRLIHSDSST